MLVGHLFLNTEIRNSLEKTNLTEIHTFGAMDGLSCILASFYDTLSGH